jgi:hypothetical protein
MTSNLPHKFFLAGIEKENRVKNETISLQALHPINFRMLMLMSELIRDMLGATVCPDKTMKTIISPYPEG